MANLEAEKTDPVTLTLIILNVVAFAGLVACSGIESILAPQQHTLIDWGANFGPLTLHGQPWRLLSNTFIHGSILHLGLNMYVLWAMGPTLEKHVGTRRYLTAYLISALIGSLVSTAWHPTLISCGASGAIFGVFGFALTSYDPGTTGYSRSEIFKRKLIVLVAFTVLNVVFAILIPGIDNAAHMGGLVAGLAAGYLFIHRNEHKLIQLTASFMFLISPLVIYGLLLGRYSDDPMLAGHRLFVRGVHHLKAKENKIALAYFDQARKLMGSVDVLLINRGHVLIELHRYDEAIKDLDEALEKTPANTSILSIRAMAFHSKGQFTKAIADFKRYIEEKPDDAMAYNNLAWCQAAAGQLDEALVSVDESIRLKGSLYAAHDTRGVILLIRNDFRSARQELDRAIALSPEQGAAYYHRGWLEKLNGSDGSADFDRAEKLGFEPEDWEVKTLSRLGKTGDDSGPASGSKLPS